MTDDQIKEAVGQMQVFCREKIECEDYDLVSARGVLYTLGYDEDKANEVLKRLFDGGFTHCFDSRFGDRPNQYGCYWSPDQLLSRLDWVAPRR